MIWYGWWLIHTSPKDRGLHVYPVICIYTMCLDTIPRSDGSVHGSYFWMNAPLPVAQLSSMLWCTLDSTLWTNNRHTKPTNIEPLFKTLLLENWMVIRKDVISCMKQRCMIVNCKLSSLDFHLKSRTLIAASKKNFESGAISWYVGFPFRGQLTWRRIRNICRSHWISIRAEITTIIDGIFN